MAQERILIVEDDGILAAHLEDTLTGLGYRVIEPAAKGEEAIDRVKEQSPDLVIMDIELAGDMDGIMAAEQIRVFSDVPIIYLTGYSQDPLLRKAKVTAPYGYLVKPVPERELAATIEMALYRHSLDMRLRESRDELEVRVRERTEELEDAYERLKKETEEREKVEQRLRQAEKMEAIGTLAGGIAHDFNNILAIIMGNAEMAIEDVENGDPPSRSLDRIFNAAKRGRDLVKEILAFSRKAQQEKAPINVVSLTEETFKFLRSTLPASIKMSLEIECEPAIILGDPSQIQQVIINLATNAADAMRDAGGSLRIRLDDASFQPGDALPDPDMAPGRYLKIMMEDTGIGMSEEVRSRIFDPFFTTKEMGRGTGMGLSAVYGIVKCHDGAITTTSTQGLGSTFTVYLPRIESGGEQERATTPVVAGNRERVLFVDDEQAITEVAETMLRRLGYRVTAVTDGKEALRLFLEDPFAFDLVITDQTMADLSGIALARSIIGRRPDLPVILCTGYSETVSAEKARESGIREFLAKPLAKNELASAIRRALGGKGGCDQG